MNKSDLVRVVAKKTRIPASMVDEVLTGVLELVVANLAMEEEVLIRGFGRFEPRERAPVTLMNLQSREPVDVGPRKTVVFMPSSTLKTKLNSAEFVTDAPKTLRVNDKRRTKKRRGVARIHHLELHQYLWRTADDRHRLPIHIGELAKKLDVPYVTANETILTMAGDGRIRHVGHVSHSRVGIFEVADPETWQHGDEETHAQRRQAPRWG